MRKEKLPKQVAKRKKRVGRGYGSGKGGHTVGRGQKGQKARKRVGLFFEGTKTRKSLVKRLPLLRGKGKFKSYGKKPVVVNLKYLELLPKDSEITLENLVKAGLVQAEQAEKFGVKILGEGELSKALIVKLPVSGGAKKKIEKAGGKVVEEKQRKKKKKVKRTEKTKPRSVKKSRKKEDK